MGDISSWVLTDWPIEQLSRSRPPNNFKTGQKRLGYLVSLLEIVKLLFQVFIPKMSSFLERIVFFKRISHICTSYMLWVKYIELIVELSLVSYVFEQFSVIRLKLARKFRRFFRACSWRSIFILTLLFNCIPLMKVDASNEIFHFIDFRLITLITFIFNRALLQGRTSIVPKSASRVI